MISRQTQTRKINDPIKWMEIPNIAIPNLPLCNKVTISIENVEKVVKAPQNQ